MKRFIILTAILMLAAPVLADEDNINMTPYGTFSGYKRSSTVQTKFPRLNHSLYDTERNQLMKPRSVKDLGSSIEVETMRSPMDKIQRQRMDSSDMMHINGIQNGIQNMYMNF